ncbi:nitrate reductase molybdenum cofactor assembly chaperone [Aestuariimicrobium sp. p3-SID1156]|uniref:nitrate reductase molybdenum cofactor assembly chaperone n=1 Tax=Aestuariimicrobium sp. p3-SID1156 TaxID=2916038 RepID=UPI00223AF1CE|nr:nitrate reductase molybdenum cofactor assembly chaperone [Aestuariimicrobium sp. p3-SID1156]MCT1457969.1 nitrate reductase molybdenum cofactor assembly chaperone [Aestuariimicrobium sp. p3-SID1156]
MWGRSKRAEASPEPSAPQKESAQQKEVGDRTVAVVYQAASLLLTYPDEELLGRLDMLEQALVGTGAEAQFAPTLSHLRSMPLAGAQSWHVQEFDISRRHALHLSYWTDGDTRRRGQVLAQFKQVYRDSGLLVDLAGELPDHLPMVLEFAAIGDPERGRDLLRRYRPSLELLRLQLEKDDLPQAGILQAICATLPGPSPTTRAEVQALAEAAMPVETVGLDGYGGDPVTFLPDPLVRPAGADPTQQCQPAQPTERP